MKHKQSKTQKNIKEFNNNVDLDEDYFDFDSPNKPKYTLTTSSDDGQTTSTSTITTTEPDALIQILKSAGVDKMQPDHDPDHDHDMDHDMDHDEEVDMEIGGCETCGGDHEEHIDDDVDMDVEFAPETPTSKRSNSHDDMKYILDIMDGTNEEVEKEVDEEWDNEPDKRDLPHDAGSMERNVSKLRHGVAGRGDNKLASGYEVETTEDDVELSKRLSEEWYESFKLHEVELTDKQKKYFGSKEERESSSDNKDEKDKEDEKDEKDETTEDKKWIQKAVNPAHKGYCTPMSKKTCTPRRKALAKRFKKGI